jgi:hypothetical protein
MVARRQQRVTEMAFEAIKAEIRATGMPLPDDLVALERELTLSRDRLPKRQ